jgi:uncharacterized protein YutE (UPF0331/DUF86 family)/predicted nucleotidyltransferase
LGDFEALKEEKRAGFIRVGVRGRRLKFTTLLRKLKGLFEGDSDIEVAILFGSVVRRGESSHDIDIALKLRRKDLLYIGQIVSQISKRLKVGEDYIDITFLDESNPILLSKVLAEGIVIKGKEEAIQQLLKRAQRAPDALLELKVWLSLEPKLDRAIITSRVDEIRRNASFIKEEVLSKGVEDLSYEDRLALERAVQRIVESMLDICRHLVSVYSLGLAESYGEYVTKLAEAKKMPKDLAEDLARLAGLRNILVHRYLEIKLDLLYRAAYKVVERVVGRFIEWVETILV